MERLARFLIHFWAAIGGAVLGAAGALFTVPALSRAFAFQIHPSAPPVAFGALVLAGMLVGILAASNLQPRPKRRARRNGLALVSWILVCLIVAVASMSWAYVPAGYQRFAVPLIGFGGALVVRRPGPRRIASGIVNCLTGTSIGILIFFAADFLTNPPAAFSTASILERATAHYAAPTPILFAFAIVGAATGLLVARYSWRTRGVLTLMALICVVLGYLLYSLFSTLPQVPPHLRIFSLALLAIEIASLTMVVLYSFYTLDVATRRYWRRAPDRVPYSAYYLPEVAIHVPTYNEPPEIVIASLQSLLRLEYDSQRYTILVGDDSTRPECAEPVRRFCQENGIAYHHRTDRSGFKAGALNHLLRHSAPSAQLIIVIDADYQVAPNFLKETVGYFVDPDLGWLQTPQDYRNRDECFLTKQYYVADQYFYRTILPSRNEENSIIFCGTMGIIRRKALQESGGWGERFITEDAEISVRLLDHGWRSLYVNRTYGHGLIPATFDAYKRQHNRWAFGSDQVLRGRFGQIFFGGLGARQRLDFVVGNMHWFEGFFILLIAFAILLMSWSQILGHPLQIHHSFEVALIGLVPLLLLLDGFLRLHFVLRDTLRMNMKNTLLILGLWYTVKFSNAFAAMRGLLGVKMAFARTPKTGSEHLSPGAALRRAFAATRFESTLMVVSMITAVTLAWPWLIGNGGAYSPMRLALAFWLVWYGLLFGSAPLYAYRSHVASTPLVQPRPNSPAVPTPG